MVLAETSGARNKPDYSKEVIGRPELIVFVGQSGAGKTTITEAIGGNKIASCDILREEVARRGLEDNHANIHAVGMELIAQDPAWQAKKALEHVILGEPFIFDGPRNPEDLEFLLHSGHKVEIVGVYSPRAVRDQRVLDREQLPITKEDFMQRCIDEILEAGLNRCLGLATTFVFNNGNSLEQIRRDAVLLIHALMSRSFPLTVPHFTDAIERFEAFIDTFPVVFTNAPDVLRPMREYLQWEETQLNGYRQDKIPLGRFL